MNLRALYLPDIAVHRRIKMLKNLLAFAMAASLLVSWKLWVGERLLLRIPAFEGLPVLNSVAEISVYSFMLLCCVLIFISRKPGVFIFLLLLSFAVMCLADINRIQPWIFEYALLFFTMLFYNWRVDEPRDYTPVFNSLRICIALFYIWDGIHKINFSFTDETWPWMMSTFNDVASYKAVSFLSKAGMVVPAIEILAALALFLPTLKRIGIPLLVLIHLINLVCLGPLGKNYNPVLWPWNIFMIFMMYTAFTGKADSRYPGFHATLRYKPLYAMLAIVVLLPMFNFAWRLNTRQLTNFNANPEINVNVELTAQAANKLPLYLSSFVAVKNGKYLLFIDKWAMHELNSPLNTSVFVYNSVVEQVKKITCCPKDVNLRFKEKSTQVAAL